MWYTNWNDAYVYFFIFFLRILNSISESHTSPSDVSEEPQSQIKRALPKSRQTRKRNIEDYDYLSELSSSNFETAPQELQGSSKMSQTVIPTTVRSYETVTRSYESSYLPPRIVKSDIDMINARPYQFKTTQSDYVGDKVGGYHTHVNVSFDWKSQINMSCVQL